MYTFTASLRYVYNIYENGWQLVKCLQKSEMYKLYPSTLFISVCQIVFSTCVQQQKKIDKIKGWPPWPAKFSFDSPFGIYVIEWVFHNLTCHSLLNASDQSLQLLNTHVWIKIKGVRSHRNSSALLWRGVFYPRMTLQVYFLWQDWHGEVFARDLHRG